MGACAGKQASASPKDPDKQPYEASSSSPGTKGKAAAKKDKKGASPKKDKKKKTKKAPSLTDSASGDEDDDRGDLTGEDLHVEKETPGKDVTGRTAVVDAPESSKVEDTEQEEDGSDTGIKVQESLEKPHMHIPSKSSDDAKTENANISASQPRQPSPSIKTEPETGDTGVKAEDVTVKVSAGLTKEPPIVKTYPTSWKPQPVQSSRTTFSSFSSSSSTHSRTSHFESSRTSSATTRQEDPTTSKERTTFDVRTTTSTSSHSDAKIEGRPKEEDSSTARSESLASRTSALETKTTIQQQEVQAVEKDKTYERNKPRATQPQSNLTNRAKEEQEAAPNEKVIVETKQSQNKESNMTVTVQSKTITEESRDNSMDLKLPSLGEPISAESILQSIRDKTKDSGIMVTSESKTTTVIKKVDPTGKQTVDIKTTEAKYDGSPMADGKQQDVLVKTTSQRFTEGKTTTESSPPKAEEKPTTYSSAERSSISSSTVITSSSDHTDTKKESSQTTTELQQSKTAEINGNVSKSESVTQKASSLTSAILTQEKLVIKEPGDVISSTALTTPEHNGTDQKAIIKNVEEKESVLRVEDSVLDKSVSSTEKLNGSNLSENLESEVVPIIESAQDEPVDDDSAETTQAQKRKEVMAVLCDSSRGQNIVIDSHEWCPNSRSRLMQCIDKWANGEDKEKDNFKRVWVVTGKVGSGKSALAAEVYRRHAHHVAGVHFFNFCSPNLDNNDARYVLRSFAFQMCESIPGYCSLLPDIDQLHELVDSSDLGKMFEVLIQKPLLSPELERGTENETVLVILDAIDECSALTRNQLLHIINGFIESTPDWLYLLATMRDDNQMLSKLENARTIELKNSNDNMSDIKRYLKEPMSTHMDRISLDGGLTQLVKKTEGNFLCAKYLAGMLNKMDLTKRIALREVDSMFPSGLSNLYKEVFTTFKQNLSGQNTPDLCQRILGLLCCILEPVSKDFISLFPNVDEEILQHLDVLLSRTNGSIRFSHKSVIEWLHNQQEAGEFHVVPSNCRQKMSEYCWKWLEPVRLEPSSASTSLELQTYALKRAVWHFLDTPKQQENVAGLLCELSYIEKKFQVPGVALRHVLSDYRHAHQYGLEATKPVTMSDYMKKHPKLLQQIQPYYNFVKTEGVKLQRSPDFTAHIAANYPHSERIQQNARLELEEKPWVEELTSYPETHNISKPYSGKIEGVDLSPDGKTLAVLSKDTDNNLALCLVNVATCEKRMDPIDIKMLKDRIGLSVKYLPDGSGIFAGSITTLINAKTGRPMASGIDASSVQMKEKFSIECCDITRKHMVFGLSTFPWGGRSLHLTAFDLKSKKSIKTVEVLKFRFGGSAHFGVKCCAISEDDTMVGACVKQNNKDQLVCSIWSMSKWNVLHTINVNGDSFTRCIFVGNESLLVGTSVLSSSEQGQQSQLWNFKGSKTITSWNSEERLSVFNSSKQGYAVLRWFMTNGTALVQIWKNKNISGDPHTSYMIQGLSTAIDIVSTQDHILIITEEEMKSYNVSDLPAHDLKEAPGITDILVKGTCFYPRTEEVVVPHSFPQRQNISVGVLSTKGDELQLESSSFPTMTSDKNLIHGKQSYFSGSSKTSDICQVNTDGNFTVFVVDRDIQLWNRASNAIDSLPSFDQVGLTEQHTDDAADRSTTCVVSPKDNLVAVLYEQCPMTVVTFDLKNKQKLRSFELPSAKVAVSDFTFVPSNGHLVTYHVSHNNTLVVWNSKTGNSVSQKEGLDLAYARMSPASDRFVLSLFGTRKLLLRNSDGNYGVDLQCSGVWDPSPSASDVEFSADGTTLTGVCSSARICRVWNAGNGEVLKDLELDFSSPLIQVLGMITNTHLVFMGTSIQVVDIGSGDTEALLPVDYDVPLKTTSLGTRVSPKGNILVGSNCSGHLKLFRCHNFSAVKRKTTLQRMKSFVKQ